MNKKSEETNIFIVIKKIAPGLLLGLIALFVVSMIGDFKEVSGKVRYFNWAYFPAAMLLTLFNYFLRFLKWHYYLWQIAIRNIPWLESLKLFVGGFPLAVTPGKVGEALKAVWISQRSSVPVSKGISVVVAERISDGLAVLALSTLGVFAYPKYWPIFFTVLAILLIIVLLSQIRPVALKLIRVSERIPIIGKFSCNIYDFYEGSFVLFRPKATALAVMLGFISWFGEGLGFYLILLGLGVSPGINTLSLAVFTLAFSTIVGAASTLPGGLGAAELSIGGMLILIMGLEPSTSAAATVLIRLATFWFGLSLGMVVWLMFPELIGIEKRKKIHAEG